MTTRLPASDVTLTAERDDIVASLQRHRGFLLHTVSGITDEQARQRTTVSELTLGGLIKHVGSDREAVGRLHRRRPGGGSGDRLGAGGLVQPAAGGRRVRLGAPDAPGRDPGRPAGDLSDVAAATDALAGSVDLDHDHPLPEAPWFPPSSRWTARRTLLHILAETSQHAGHADIIREALDGQKTMG